MRPSLIAFIAMLVASSVLAQDMPLSQVVIDGEGWSIASKGYDKIHSLQGFTTGAIGISHSKGTSMIQADTDMSAVKQMEYDSPELPETFTVAANMHGYFASPVRKAIIVKNMNMFDKAPTGLRIPGLVCPSCMAFTNDFGTLFVGDRDGKSVWVFRVDKDGGLTAGQPYCPLRINPNQTASGVAGLTLDKAGRIYAATPLGVQIFDPTGRLCGVLNNPSGEPSVAVAFGGPDGKRLFVATKTTVYMRKVQARGLSFAPDAEFTIPPAIKADK